MSLAQRLRLMVVTDPGPARDRSVLDVVAAALAAGATAIQLRDKHLAGRELCRLGDALVALCQRHGALCLINDRLDVALACAADGVHLGQEDLPADRARAIAGPGFVVGVSAGIPAEARAAAAAGADYIGTGSVFATGSKPDAGAPIGPKGLAEVARASALPVVAIGGIDARNASQAIAAGASGVAVISAVMRAPDPGAATRGILAALERGWPA